MKCEKCNGTGLFIVGMHNNQPVSKGKCFRCAGKGFQTGADTRRNWGYDRYAESRLALSIAREGECPECGSDDGCSGGCGKEL